MKVLIFSTVYLPLVGGAEIAMKEITDRISGIDFHLICAKVKPHLPSVEMRGNVMVHRVGFGKPIDKYLLPFLGTLKALRLDPRSSGAQRPIIWSLMASYNGFAALFTCWLFPRAQFLLTLQEGDPIEYIRKRTGWLTFLHRMVFRRANTVQAISRFLAAWSTKMGFRGEPVVIPNGVDIEKFSWRGDGEAEKSAIRTSFGFLESDIVLITTSRLSLKNGVDDLIRSLTFLPTHVKALIVGEGEDGEKLEALTKEKGLTDRVRFAGRRSHDELPRLLWASDIFIRPSLSEGLGNSFLEAMMCGVPIIGTPVGGIPDFLTDRETGLFCKPRDPASIANAVQVLLSDGELRDRLRKNGMLLVRERYDWNTIAARMKQLLVDCFGV